MTGNTVEILLVDDNSNDEMLVLHEFKKHSLASKVHVVRAAQGGTEHANAASPLDA
jgi:hypothetical protein